MNAVTQEIEGPSSALSFLWLELTNRCNLACQHCYADSAPRPSIPDALGEEEYRALIGEAAALDCRRIQFIGGEPTLVPFLPNLIRLARALEYEFVEVFTNATHMSDELLQVFLENRVNVATSFYCDDATIHDLITRRPGSHARTVRGIERAVRAGLEVRAGIIGMEENKARIPETWRFLERLGVRSIKVDEVRGVGRGVDAKSCTTIKVGKPGQSSDSVEILQELCGNCWRDSVCVSPTGEVTPCIMARQMTLGNVRERTLSELAGSNTLLTMRRRIYDFASQRAAESIDLTDPMQGTSARCPPSCPPHCSPICSPTSCGPNACWPSYGCSPK